MPGPAIGFLQECLRWWDHWLKGIETGIMDEPTLRVWMQESAPPASLSTRSSRAAGSPSRPGRARASSRMPMAFNAGRLGPAHRGRGRALPIRSPLATSGCSAGALVRLRRRRRTCRRDQREDDGRSLVFDTRAARRDGSRSWARPRSSSSSRPTGRRRCRAVRLNDVAPDGASPRVTYGLLNLTHRDSHEDPAAAGAGRASTG